jgi:AraC-like DNA-binding protein
MHTRTTDETQAGLADIPTYKMVDRSARPDFEIRDQAVRPPLMLPHRHEYFQIEANLSGDAHHIMRRCDGAAYPAPRSLVFVLPYRVHVCDARARYPLLRSSTSHCNFLRTGFAPSPLELEEASIVDYPELTPFIYEGYVDFVFSEAEFEHVQALLQRLVELNRRRTLGTLPRIQGTLLELIGFATERYASELQALSENRVYLQGRSDALRRVLKYIDAHLHEAISLNEVAEAAFLSPNYLSQVLKKQTGLAFVEWLTVRRMERAQELLAHGSERVYAVANAVGFSDGAYFTRRFGQRFGIAPTAYRRSMREAS